MAHARLLRTGRRSVSPCQSYRTEETLLGAGCGRPLEDRLAANESQFIEREGKRHAAEDQSTGLNSTNEGGTESAISFNVHLHSFQAEKQEIRVGFPARVP